MKTTLKELEFNLEKFFKIIEIFFLKINIFKGDFNYEKCFRKNQL
jgi:hypothetical protein